MHHQKEQEKTFQNMYHNNFSDFFFGRFTASWREKKSLENVPVAASSWFYVARPIYKISSNNMIKIIIFKIMAIYTLAIGT